MGLYDCINNFIYDCTNNEIQRRQYGDAVPNKANQGMRIFNYMKQNGGITGIEATNILHIMDYRKRISEMRKKGINIGDEWQRKTDKNGMPVRYKRYFLIEN